MTRKAEEYSRAAWIEKTFVYEDGVVKGFIQIDGEKVAKLFVEPVLQGWGIGVELLNYAIREQKVTTLWALEKNVRAVSFYKKHGFYVTDDKKFEKETTEYLVCLAR